MRSQKTVGKFESTGKVNDMYTPASDLVAEWIQCAVVLAKFEKFEWEVEHRLLIGKKYNQLLDQAGIQRVVQYSERESVFAQYTLIVNDRESVQNKLLKKGIPSAIHYPIPINEQKAYKHLCCPDCTPISSDLSQKVLSIPMGPYLKPENQTMIVNELVQLIK